MTPTPVLPEARRLLLVGGGHAHIGVLRRLAMRPVPGLSVALVTPDARLDYSGMLPARIAGHYEAAAMQIDLRRLARLAGAEFLAARATGLDPLRRRLHLAGRPSLVFDLASLDIGSAPAALAADPQACLIPVKPVDRLMAGIHSVERRYACAARSAHLVVIGGGAGGIELILSLAHRFADWTQPPALTLVTRGDRLLAGQRPAAARRLHDALARAGVTVIAGRAVARVAAREIVLSDDRRLPADAVFCATGAQPPDWLADTGLALDEQGFVAVDWTLASRSHPTIFAVGDIAALPAPRPKSGVFAVREAPILAENLIRAARDEPRRRFKAPRAALALISLGSRRAIAVRGRYAIGPSAGLWRLKDWIDRRFIARFNALEPMTEHDRPPRADRPVRSAETAAAPTMRCAGCGGKLGRDALSRALQRLADDGHASVIGLADGFADAAPLAAPASDETLVQSVDQITDPIGDPWRFGVIAARHALNDLYAAGARPASALVTAGLPFAAADISADRLDQMLAGVASVLDETGARLAGGHTAEAETLTLGLAVTGIRGPREDVPVAIGDALILTRALGSGILLAADRLQLAAGSATEALIGSMMTSAHAAAATLDAHGGHRRTDVTGFGLTLHLSQLLATAGVAARLDVARLPLVEDVLSLAAAGVRSSLHQRNVDAAATLVTDRSSLADDPRMPMLADPQTAGGLLAIVPAASAEACLDALHAAGFGHAARIGRVAHGASGQITLAPI